MVDHLSCEFSEVVFKDSLAYQIVKLITRNGTEAVFAFRLSQQRGDEYQEMGLSHPSQATAINIQCSVTVKDLARSTQSGHQMVLHVSKVPWITTAPLTFSKPVEVPVVGVERAWVF